VVGDGGDSRPVNASRLVGNGDLPRPKLAHPSSANEPDGHVSSHRQGPPVATSVCQSVTRRDGHGTATRRFSMHSDEQGLAGRVLLADDLMRGQRE
jgi:hypothetical protein